MGYVLQAFLGKDINLIQQVYSVAVVWKLDQEISLIPMTNELFDQMNGNVLSDDITSFAYLTINIENKVLPVMGNKLFAYIEADYFGGNGGQVAVIWEDQKRIKVFDYGKGIINKVLQHLGVKSVKRKDEFHTLNLGRFRNTSEWIENYYK